MKQNIRYTLLGLALVFFAVIFFYFNSGSREIAQPKTTKTTPDKAGIKEASKQTDTIKGQSNKTTVSLAEQANDQTANHQLMENTVTIGSSKFSALFEDGDYSQTLQKILIKDMNLIFGHMNQFEILPYSKKSFSIYGSDVSSQKRIYFSGPGRYWPSIYRNNFGFIIDDGEDERLIITNELVQAYKKAEAFQEDNKEAFEKLSQFIDLMNTGSKTEMASSDIDSLFYFSNGSDFLKNKYKEDAMALITQFTRYEWREPSILDVNYENNSLVAHTYVIDSQKTPVSETGLIYDDSNWKILIVNPGT